ncbi:beta-1,3-galactosyltransferase 2 [Synchiropus splendidus]|uniref:beta-1,3-galactosyltransferase 2 n=1 Tax=Synchiropus splendidus TaxID=270530 RepID=UPI00237DCCF2|nr:beta-1,3-galactosyltransferase 2 [Synchiropus splendidus]
MQWKRRHCCTHTARLLYLLSLLGVLIFLVHQVWLPKFAGLHWWRDHPVVHRVDKGNLSAQHPMWRFVIVPQATVANITLPQQEVTISQLNTSMHDSAVTHKSRNQDSGTTNELTPGPFRYTVNEPNKCADDSPAPFLVFLIATEARQVEARNAIRQTWANETVVPTVRVIRLFLLGRTDGELGTLQQRMLEAESRRHHDIIQQDFLDTYKNLTMKTLMGMNWVALHCPQASYVMKTDSDMFVNAEYLISKLLKPEQRPKKNYFTGNNMRNFSPNRNKNSKWYMPPELYPGTRYPTFCSGTGYVFSGDLATKIYKVSLRIPFLHLEDVYVGICLAELRIEPTLPPNGFLFNHWRVAYSSCKYSHLITSHGFNPNELLKYWHHLQTNKHNACISMFKERGGAGGAGGGARPKAPRHAGARRHH